MLKRRIAIAATLTTVVVVAAAIGFRSFEGNPSLAKAAAAAGATFVGSESCAGCHPAQAERWRSSQHRLAMQPATEQTVLGDFNAAHFDSFGVHSRFFRRDGRFLVETDGFDGKLATFEIKYTFGIDPLQQYLVGFPGGRLQALPLAWNSRPRQTGGQRWFHLYPNERIRHDDVLHWTGPNQNWNFMCADCHSTELRKNYDAAADRFATSWSEISIGCEACHGPGSAHVGWAKQSHPADLHPDQGKALSAQLDERRGVTWARDATAATATRSRPRATEREIEVCAQCHARRSQLADGYTAGKQFLDYYRPALLVAPLYWPDGQQRDEVYGWGSFLQSKMYAAGVTCSDCHDPHSGGLRAQGNAVCTRCHAASSFDGVVHHHHRPGSAGAQCVNCHMPAATYMVIDPRHDHSLRIPRPDLSAELGTPNACSACHRERGARWAGGQLKTWFGHDPAGYQRFASAFAAANAGALGAGARLRAVAGDPAQPAIARATALAAMNAAASSAALQVVAAGLRDPSALVRLGALESLAAAPAPLRLQYAVPLLSDPIRAIRIEAASALADVAVRIADGEQRAAFERAAAEYVAAQRYNADRVEARTNLGSFEARRGDAARAVQELRAAIALDPRFVPAYIDLADIYRAQGGEADAERTLRQGLARSPASAPLHHALGLALVRAKRTEQALSELAKAVTLDPADARFAYVYGVALYSEGHIEQAISTLVRASARHPTDVDILEALVTYYRNSGNEIEAKRYVERLRAVAAAS